MKEQLFLRPAITIVNIHNQTLTLIMNDAFLVHSGCAVLAEAGRKDGRNTALNASLTYHLIFYELKRHIHHFIEQLFV